VKLDRQNLIDSLPLIREALALAESAELEFRGDDKLCLTIAVAKAELLGVLDKAIQMSRASAITRVNG
jgi:hypothetical protein